MDLLLHLVQVDMSNGAVSIKDLGEFLEGGTFGFDVEEVDEDKFDEDPDCVDEREIVVMGKVVPCNWVGVAV